MEWRKGARGEKRGSGAIRRSSWNTERARESEVGSQYLNSKTTRKQLVTPHRFFSSFAARKAGPEAPRTRTLPPLLPCPSLSAPEGSHLRLDYMFPDQPAQ